MRDLRQLRENCLRSKSSRMDSVTVQDNAVKPRSVKQALAQPAATSVPVVTPSCEVAFKLRQSDSPETLPASRFW